MIHQLEVRSRYGGDEGTDVTFSVRGDECVYITPDLGGQFNLMSRSVLNTSQTSTLAQGN